MSPNSNPQFFQSEPNWRIHAKSVYMWNTDVSNSVYVMSDSWTLVGGRMEWPSIQKGISVQNYSSSSFCSTKIHGLSSKKSIEITSMGLTFLKTHPNGLKMKSTTPTPNPCGIILELNSSLSFLLRSRVSQREHGHDTWQIPREQVRFGVWGLGGSWSSIVVYLSPYRTGRKMIDLT